MIFDAKSTEIFEKLNKIEKKEFTACFDNAVLIETFYISGSAPFREAAREINRHLSAQQEVPDDLVRQYVDVGKMLVGFYSSAFKAKLTAFLECSCVAALFVPTEPNRLKLK